MQGKLIIFEDVERSQIDLLSLLGYINSLVEQDNVKVLLVANEDKIIQYEEIKRNDGSIRYAHTKETRAYFEIKEKTISDTIQFEANLSETIQHIIRSFSNADLLRLCDDAHISNIIEIMRSEKSHNFRSFIFACQKIVDVFECVQHSQMEIDDDFRDCIFYGLISYSVKLKKGEKVNWEDSQSECSFKLGFRQYPLFRFCYDYVENHIFDDIQIQKTIEILHDLRMYDKDKSNNDKDLIIINDYHEQSEKDVREAIKSIEAKLHNDRIIAFSQYGRLGLNLIRISHLLNINIENIKASMILNLYGKGDQLRPEALSDVIEDDRDTSVIKEYNNLKAKMIESLLIRNEEDFYGFDYTPSTIDDFFSTVARSIYQIEKEGGLASRIDIPKLVKTIKQCSSREICSLRNVFLEMYGDQVLDADVPNLTILLEELKKITDYQNFDAIQKFQIELFIQNISNFISTAGQEHSW